MHNHFGEQLLAIMSQQTNFASKQEQMTWDQYSRFTELRQELCDITDELRTSVLEAVNSKNDQQAFEIAVENNLHEMALFYANYRKVKIIGTDITPHMIEHCMDVQFVNNVDIDLREYKHFNVIVQEIEKIRTTEAFNELRSILSSRCVNKERVARFAIENKLIELARCYNSQEYITLRELFCLTRREYTNMLNFSALGTYPRAHSLGKEIETTKKNALKRASDLSQVNEDIANCTNLEDLPRLNRLKQEIEFGKAHEILQRYESFANCRKSQHNNQQFFNYAIDNNLKETAIYMYLCMGCVVCTQFEEIVRKIEEQTPVKGMGELETKSGASSCLNLHYGSSGTGKKASLQKIFEGLRHVSKYDKYADGVEIGTRKYGHQFKSKYLDELWGKRLPSDPPERIEESFAETSCCDHITDDLEQDMENLEV